MESGADESSKALMLPKRGKKVNLLMNALICYCRWIKMLPERVKIMNLVSLVRFHRKAAELSQIELAALANVSRKVVQCIESGGNQVSWKNVQAVLAVLNVTLMPSGPLVSQWQGSIEPQDQEA
jgi:DNA-binding XRE family transcriptional regulator